MQRTNITPEQIGEIIASDIKIEAAQPVIQSAPAPEIVQTLSPSISKFLQHVETPSNVVNEVSSEAPPVVSEGAGFKIPVEEIEKKASEAAAPPVVANEAPARSHSLRIETQSKVYTQLLDSAVFGLGFTAAYKAKYNKKIGKDNLVFGFEFLNECEALSNGDKAKYKHFFELGLNQLEQRHAVYVYHAKRMQEKLANVRLTDEEKADLIESLNAIIEDNGGKMPAWLGVAITAISIAAPRIVDLISD